MSLTKIYHIYIPVTKNSKLNDIAIGFVNPAPHLRERIALFAIAE